MAGNVPSWQKLQNTPNKNAHSTYGGYCDAAKTKAAAAATRMQSQSQDVDSGDEVLGLLGFDCHQQKRSFGD